MRIGILGVGHIGASLARQLGQSGHDVVVANSKGPETIPADSLTAGARAVCAEEAATEADALILSVPLNRLAGLAPIVAALPPHAVVLDTSNYYPGRDGRIDELEDGQVESVWVSEQIGRSVVKAWNAIGAHSLAVNGKPAKSPGRIAIPVAADSDEDRAVGISLVSDTGFDGLDAGVLEDSWRQQPGTPAYCNDFTQEELRDALAAANRSQSALRRDLMVHTITELTKGGAVLAPDYFVRLGRVLNS